MTKVLYITYDGLTDPLGQSQVLPYLQQLAEKGFCFTILSFEKRDRFLKEGPAVQEIISKVGIRWKPLFFTAKPPVLSKMWDRYQMQRAAIHLHKKDRFNLVHCRSYVAAEVGLLLKRRFGVKMLFDMRGFWADEKVDNGQWDLKKSFFKQVYHFYKRKEKQFLLEADGIVSLTHAAKEHLLQQPSFKQLSINVIPCCADLQHFDYNSVDDIAINALRKELKIPASAKVLTYLGSVGGWYMTKEMFRFFYLLQQHDPAYVLLILTKDDVEQVKQEARTAGIPPEKILVTYATRNVLPVYLALSTCSIFFIRNTFSKIASSPTKHAELMGMGIPVVCNSIGDTGAVIKQTGTGLLVEEFDTQHMNAAVIAISSLEKMLPKYIRNHALEMFDLKTGVQNYLNLYTKILQ